MFYQDKNSLKNSFRVNHQIRSREVFLVDEKGKSLGIKPIQVAQSIAKDRDLDLVEVEPNANPPVCRLLDSGKFRYELEKKNKKSKKSGKVKEIRLGVNTEDHDFQTRLRQAQKFIERGNKIRLTVKMSGRENIYANRASDVIDKFKNELNLEIEQKPVRMENRVSVILTKSKQDAKD